MVECCSVNKVKGDNCARSRTRHRNQQLKLNMFVASLFQLQISVSQTVVFSSIYLFVTSPTVCLELSCGPSNHSDIQESMTDQQHSWSGLGESDFFYSLISTSRGIGLLLGSFVAGFLPAFVPFRGLMLLGSIIYLMDNLLYANATKGWMILVAQFLGLGLSRGMLYVFFLSYVTNTCIHIEESEQITIEELEETNKETNTCRVKSKKGRRYSLKDKFLIMNLLMKNIGWPLGVAISSVMAQFEQTVDQFRWPGWAVAFILVVFSLLFHLVYRKVETDSEKAVDEGFCLKFRRLRSGISRRSLKRCCSSASLKLLSCRNVVVYTYLGYTGFLSFSVFTAVDTLLSPALSDHFGFSIVYISYFFLGIMMIAFCASLVLVLLKSMRVNNRMVLIVSLVMSLIGSMMATDWQAIGQDPCSIHFTHAQTSISNNDSYSFVNGTIVDLTNNFDYQEIDPAMSNISILAVICMAGSSETHECYWNADSKITGTFCSLCRKVCRAESMTVSFAQFSLGMGFITVASLLMWISVLGIATDCTVKEAQSRVVGMLYTIAGISVITTPLWCIWIYDSVGKRLFGPMIIWSVLALLSLVGCVVLYKLLGPINVSNKMKKDNDLKVRNEIDNTGCVEDDGNLAQVANNN